MMATSTTQSLRRIMALSLVTACLLTAPLASQDSPGRKLAADAAAGPTSPLPDEGQPGTDEDGAPELTEAADVAIEKGLKYLLASQKPDGSWSSEGGASRSAGHRWD